MKRLIFLRHAEAEPHHIGGDHARMLTDKGMHDADAVGTMMKAKGITPDLILCSDAVRTRQTCEAVQRHITAHTVRFENALYESHTDAYIDLISHTPDTTQSVMVIGHNPVIHQCALHYANDDGNVLYNRLMCMYPPGTVTVLDFAEGTDIAPSCGVLSLFETV